jgi:acetyl-CoA decarbonylase/synthase complex subunit gamma
MYVEAVFVNHVPGKGDDAKYLGLVKKALELGRAIIISCADPALAKAALELTKGKKPILCGADAQNYTEMNTLAVEFEAVLGVGGSSLDEIYETVAAVEKLGNKNLVINAGTESIKDAFAKTIQVRRAAIMGEDRTFGYPVIVNAGRLSGGNKYLQAALASLFTMKFGSIVVLDGMDYALALPLYGLRQNIFTDPQKPMRVEPGIYPINGGGADSICLTTVDFALTYFIVSGELERSGVPVNLLISDAGGYSVLTAWAAGKLSASSIAKFISEFEIENKIKNRILILPGKVAVLKGELQDKLPDWKVVVGPQESIELVRFLQQYK